MSREEVVAWARDNVLNRADDVSVFLSVSVWRIVECFGLGGHELPLEYQNLKLKISCPLGEFVFTSRFTWIPTGGGYVMMCFELPLFNGRE